MLNSGYTEVVKIIQDEIPIHFWEIFCGIINMSSIVCCMTQPLMGGMYHYRSTKAGLNGVTVGLSMDLKEEGFIVISVHPGLVSTDMGGADAPVQDALFYVFPFPRFYMCFSLTAY